MIAQATCSGSDHWSRHMSLKISYGNRANTCIFKQIICSCLFPNFVIKTCTTLGQRMPKVFPSVGVWDVSRNVIPLLDHKFCPTGGCESAASRVGRASWCGFPEKNGLSAGFRTFSCMLLVIASWCSMFHPHLSCFLFFQVGIWKKLEMFCFQPCRRSLIVTTIQIECVNWVFSSGLDFYVLRQLLATVNAFTGVTRSSEIAQSVLAEVADGLFAELDFTMEAIFWGKNGDFLCSFELCTVYCTLLYRRILVVCNP